MLKQEILVDPLSHFNCYTCQRKAHEPIVTRCGHLFCWRCFYEATKVNQKCPLCELKLSRQDVYPMFIDNDHGDQSEQNIPERPPPTNQPKVANAGIMSARENISRNNIAMGRPIAGQLFLPSLGVSAWSQMGEIEQGEPQKRVSTGLKLLFIVFTAALLAIWGTYLLL